MASPLHRRAILWLLLATLLWSVSFPIVQILYQEQRTRLPDASTLFLSTALMAARFAIAAIVLLPFVIHMRPGITRLEWQQGLLLACYGGAGMWLQADALAHTKSSTCAFLTQGYCVLLPLAHALKHRRMPDASVLVAVLMVLLGMAWLSGVSLHDLRPGRGESETLLAAGIFTLQILCLESPRFRHNRSLPITWVMFAGIATAAAPVAYWLAHSPHDITLLMTSTSSWLLTGCLAILCGIAAFGIMNRWQAAIPAVQAGLIYCCEPVFTSILAMFLPSFIGSLAGLTTHNEQWTWPLIGGGILITLANLIVQLTHTHHSGRNRPGCGA